MAQLSFESISMELTKRCNLACKFCYAAPVAPQSPDLTSQEICSFLERFRQSGGRRVLFTGGEAFLRSDLGELISAAVSLGLMVDLFSNGTVISEKHIDLIASKVNLVNISIDGPATLHDELRGVPGSFERTAHSLEMLHSAGARFGIQCMVVPENMEDMDWLIELCRRVEPMMIKLGHVSRMGRGRHQDDLLLSEQGMSQLKAMAGRLSEECGHFHVRVITNIVTAPEFRAFYPSFSQVIQPWMLPDGRILSCYAPGVEDYWTISTAGDYPASQPAMIARHERLAAVAHSQAAQLPYFDLLELVYHVAEAMASDAGSAETDAKCSNTASMS